MKAIELGKNLWILTVGGLILLVVILAIAGGVFGAGSLKETCKDINWQSEQCRALKRVDWAKRNGLNPSLVEGYYSLPEDER